MRDGWGETWEPLFIHSFTHKYNNVATGMQEEN